LVVDMAVVEILMMLVKEDLLVEEGSKILLELDQLLHQIQHKEMLVEGNILLMQLIEVVAEVVQVVQVNLVLMLLAVMPLVVQDLLFLSLLHH
jgi:hypothetical protein